MKSASCWHTAAQILMGKNVLFQQNIQQNAFSRGLIITFSSHQDYRKSQAHKQAWSHMTSLSQKSTNGDSHMWAPTIKLKRKEILNNQV